MRIAICEDDRPSRDFEANLIRGWAQRKNINITLDSFSSSENFLFEYEDRIEYDLIVLDIQMGKMNGFELAKTLRARGYSGQIAFLTGIMDYALEGYEVGAVRYILKPVKEQNLFEVLDRSYEEFSKAEEKVFVLKQGSEVSKIPFTQIVYIEAQGHYIHLSGCKKLSSDVFEKNWKGTFSTVSKDFESQNFFCLRRGLLVNILHIQKITRTECILDTGESLPVARGNYEELNQAFISYYMEKNV